MSSSRFRFAVPAAALLLVGSLAACSSGKDANAATGSTGGEITIGAFSNGAAKQSTVTVAQVDSIRAEVPKSILDSGTLVIGLGLLPAGAPPLGFTGSDQKTTTGSEPDFGRLIAAVFGLKPDLQNATWENLFVGIDSGRTNVGISNITDTEQRKLKYDFASYRQDNLGFEALASNSWNFDGNFENLAGKTVSVGAGTNQEKILLQWQTQLKNEGKTLTVKYFPDSNGTYLALDSGKIDAYFAPNPSIAYHVSQTAKTPNATRSAGKFSGAGAPLQGLICATTKKDSGLIKALADALNYLIKNGQYGKVLDAWGLTNEAVDTSLVNPPGLPLSNS